MRVAVVGSGPSGFAASAELIARGAEVDLFDGGRKHEDPEFVAQLAQRLRQGRAPTLAQLARLRGQDADASSTHRMRAALAVLRGRIDSRSLEKRIVGSRFAFVGSDELFALSRGWLPRSSATGGLANAWGAACYSLRDEDYVHWPIDANELSGGFARAAELLTLHQTQDPLETAYPLHGPLRRSASDHGFDQESVFERLLEHWHRHQQELADLDMVAGRSRLAVSPPGASDGCVRCGLCTFGCALGAIFTPAPVVERWAKGAALTHRTGWRVDAVEGRPGALTIHGTEAGQLSRSGPYDVVMLAAGALGSFRIAVRSLAVGPREGTMQENDMALLPLFISEPRLPSKIRFSLSEAVIAFAPGAVARHAAHLQLYRLTEPLLGPVGSVLASLPSKVQTVVGRLMGAMAVGFLYFHGADSRPIALSYDPRTDVMDIDAPAEAVQSEGLAATLRLLQRARPALRLVPLSPLARLLPLGFSAHYGASLPLAKEGGEMTCRPNGELRGMPGVYVVDLSALPAIPAQNASYIAMANAIRVVRAL